MDSNESDVWLLMNSGADEETVRSKALDLLNSSKIWQSFKIALSLNKPDFVSHLCSVFQNCPKKLFEDLMKSKESQKLLIGLLDQLISDGVIDLNKRWKIPLITGLVTRIDMKCPVSKSSVPRLADHWANVMTIVKDMGGEHSQIAKLLAINLKHISSEFY